MPKLPLSRFTVLDLTRVRSGPAAVRQFADWGANVIKIEEPGDVPDDKPGGSSQFADYQNTHRNKRSVTLNLKHPEGKALFMEMVKQADVVIENYRPNVKFKLGIDYESLRKVNPRIILASVSGFGQDGPYVDRPGLDQIAQGLGGIMSVTGEPGRGPMRAGIPVADLTSGLFCAIGTLVALLEREESGEGQWVQSSLLQAQVWMMDFQIMRWLMNKEIPGQTGNNHPTTAATGVYPTSDGFINLAAMGTEMFVRLVKALGRPEIAEDARFKDIKTRGQHRPALNELIAECTKEKPSAYWIDVFNKEGVPCGYIKNVKETMEDPQVVHLGMAKKLQHPKLGEISVVNQAVIMSRSKRDVFTAAPDRGEHNHEVYAEFGISAERVNALAKAGAI
ncbi:CoA transferase [Alcaligenaceae bacterium LF4-65]|jgi:crotonobetainyl-CoA:carnitine CoA-transferase CaiB-like acyl-CoA transferase|uniref:CoA transferase n=1 Tax=Zwartia hollandica TaxID=324606 RepID=A0A953N8L4_9BURK|nr:CoA transferase [Zwartia hollandica]MBZ1350184.1 CoA transferase [Zwartia hollandica]